MLSYSGRKTLLSQVPNRLRKADRDSVFCHFRGKCILSGEEKHLTYDHFVPLFWGTVVFKYGIGGHTYANMILLSQRLNYSKKSQNPFEWYKREGDRFKIPAKEWKWLVKHVAAKHQMTPDEYERRVYACHVEVKAIQWMDDVNKKVRWYLKSGKYTSNPRSFIDSALYQNFNIAVVIEVHGSDDTKKLFNSEAFKQMINECKAQRQFSIE
ncbi:hypothetical protein [Paenibacillus sp. R14(2021)]|uniref:hypothetical protein n=1 Tax=Paenibacillus sp. R14(2021) TaxID=2859228 RepID=UPI001C61354A|nr:hypothetical protein [Paenibacillus sp. R14(2021)]